MTSGGLEAQGRIECWVGTGCLGSSLELLPTIIPYTPLDPNNQSFPIAAVDWFALNAGRVLTSPTIRALFSTVSPLSSHEVDGVRKEKERLTDGLRVILTGGRRSGLIGFGLTIAHKKQTKDTKNPINQSQQLPSQQPITRSRLLLTLTSFHPT